MLGARLGADHLGPVRECHVEHHGSLGLERALVHEHHPQDVDGPGLGGEKRVFVRVRSYDVEDDRVPHDLGQSK